MLVLEAGADVTNWLGTVPAGAVLMVPTKLHNYGFETVPQPGSTAGAAMCRAARCWVARRASMP